LNEWEPGWISILDWLQKRIHSCEHGLLADLIRKVGRRLGKQDKKERHPNRDVMSSKVTGTYQLSLAQGPGDNIGLQIREG
jgi:hypothetical protein